MKRFFNIVTLAIIAMAAISCNEIDDIINPRVAILLPESEILERWAYDAENLKAAFDEYGYKTALYTVEETPEGAKEQVRQLREVIDRGYKTIVITAVDYKTINDSGLIKQDDDINFICHDRIILGNRGVDYISTSQLEEVGVIQAQYLISCFEASGKESMTLEILAGPETDLNAKPYFDGAIALLKPYIDKGKLIVKSGKTTYAENSVASWEVKDAQAEMLDRLNKYYYTTTGAASVPDLILAATDNQAEGVINAIKEKGYRGKCPVITGQDNTEKAKQFIRDGLMGMTIDKHIKDMAYNTAIIANSCISLHPVKTTHFFDNEVAMVPALYAGLTLVTAANVDLDQN